jgi:hypothetical protein
MLDRVAITLPDDLHPARQNNHDKRSEHDHKRVSHGFPRMMLSQ